MIQDEKERQILSEAIGTELKTVVQYLHAEDLRTWWKQARLPEKRNRTTETGGKGAENRWRERAEYNDAIGTGHAKECRVNEKEYNDTIGIGLTSRTQDEREDTITPWASDQKQNARNDAANEYDDTIGIGPAESIARNERTSDATMPSASEQQRTHREEDMSIRTPLRDERKGWKEWLQRHHRYRTVLERWKRRRARSRDIEKRLRRRHWHRTESTARNEMREKASAKR
jgi:hypothetical protein